MWLDADALNSYSPAGTAGNDRGNSPGNSPGNDRPF
jgi:hypothetical protein